MESGFACLLVNLRIRYRHVFIQFGLQFSVGQFALFIQRGDRRPVCQNDREDRSD